MREQLDVMSLTQVVDGPPTQDFVDGSGKLIKEPCVLIGWVDLPADRRRYLEDLGVNMAWAEHDADSQRWERCLLSEGVADLLEDLHAEGDFPHAFEVGPSQGELEWLEAQARGAMERPELSLASYLIPAHAERLVALTELSGGREHRH